MDDVTAVYPAVSNRIAAELGDPYPVRGSITRLAEAVGVTSASTSRWVSGQSSPDPALWPKIEAHLGLKPGTLSEAARSDLPANRETLDIAHRVELLETLVSRQAEVLRELVERLERG